MSDPKQKREIAQSEARDKMGKMIAGYKNHGHPEILKIKVQRPGFEP